ncbi:MAG: PLP-dependent transferase [Gemmatimonadetes bacterium]|nr:PLP-dependent transferase [Gemmatimonadota bacterium]
MIRWTDESAKIILGNGNSSGGSSVIVRVTTQAVHAGREDLGTIGVHAPPLDLSSTYPVPDLFAATADLDALAAGAPGYASSPIYSRLHNPTVARVERAVAQLEHAPDAVAFASGMAAMTAVLLAVTARGRHVVAVRPLYGGTDHLLESGLLGMQVTWATPQGVGAAIRPDTALVVIETPGNPTCALIDIAAVVVQCRGVPVLVDSTFATPILQQPLVHGAAFALHSATKFLAGHGDVLGGVVATDEQWAAELRKVRIATGGVMHPLAAYLLHRGLPTLPLRVRFAQESAAWLAERLEAHPAVIEVRYPGRSGGDPMNLVGRQMRGPGPMLAFTLRGGFDAARRVMGSVRLITPAVSLGSVDTLIQHPAGLTHRVLSDEARSASGIVPGLLRLSPGLEDPEDVWDDLRRALEASQALHLDEIGQDVMSAV